MAKAATADLEPVPTQRKRGKRVRWLALTAIAAILIVAFFAVRAQGPQAASPGSDDLAVVTRGSLKVKILETGRVEPAIQAQIRSRVGGEVTQVLVTEGQNVRKGDVLLRLDPTDYLKDVQRIAAEVDERRVQLAQAIRRQKRAISSVPHGIISASEAEDADSDLAMARARLRASVVSHGTALDRVRYTTIVAPFSGRVIARNVHPGEVVVPGMTATVEGRPLMVLADISKLSIRAELNQMDFARARVGQRVQITFDSLAGQEFKGEVVALAASSTRGASGSDVLPVQIRVFPAEGLSAVMPGMSADVEIAVTRKDDVLLLPIETVGTESSGQKVVLAWAGPEQGYQRRVIRTGDHDEHHVQILSGVSEGTGVRSSGPGVAPNQ